MIRRSELMGPDEALVFACPNCAGELKTRAEHAGKKASCKWCSSPIVVPAAKPRLSMPMDGQALEKVAKDLFGDAVAAGPAADAPPAPVAAARPAGAPVEPWFYAFLHAYAMLGACVGISAPIFGLLIGGLGDSSSGGLIILYGLAIGLGCLAFAAPILLAVDAARNLRSLRYRFDNEPRPAESR